MILTETEATTKWCPFVRGVAFERDTSHNRAVIDGKDAPVGQCIASACMAWRWQPLMANEAYLAAVRKAVDSGVVRQAEAAKHVNANRAKYGLPDVPFQGRCGLAGEEIGSSGL